MPQTVTPDAIFQVATGFMASKHLFVAAEIGLFEHIADAGATLDDLSARTNVPRRTLRMIADAMVALGFIERRGDLYVNSAVAATYLAGRTAADLRPMMRFFNRLSYRRWLQFETAIRTDGASVAGYHGDFTEDDQRVFSEGVESVTTGAAQAVAARYDFARHRRVVDIGGGTGSFLMYILTAHSHLQGTLFELPAVTDLARQRLGASGLASRVTVRDGDFIRDPIPRDHDVAILANVIHLYLPEQNVALLRAIRDAMPRGARLLIVDVWTDTGHTDPVFAAMMTGAFLLSSGTGDVYSRDEGESWFRETGWQPVDHMPLVGPSSLLIGEAA